VKSPENEAVFSHPMKIAHCFPDHHWINEMLGENPKDAAYIQQKYIANGLRARGYSITWVAPHNLDRVCVSDKNGTSFAPQTWTASHWFKFLEKVFWNFQQLLRIPYLNFFSNLRRYDACMQILPGHEIVFERNGLYNAGVSMACKKLNLPYVIFFDADQMAEMDFMGKPLTKFLRWHAGNILRKNLNVAHRIICVSKGAKIRLMEVWKVPSEKIVVLPNAVDVQCFKPDPELGAQTRISLQLTDCPLVVFVGNFYQWHDVATLLKAFVVVRETHSDARLLLLGDGGEREKMMKLSAELGLEHAVLFTGFVSHSEVSRHVNAADIAVVPMPKMELEMWLSPMKLFEYMASGKAIVASAMGQNNEVISDGSNGLLVTAGDKTALANAINKLIEDAPLRAQLGKQAREDAVRNHSWEHYISHLEGVFVDANTFAVPKI